MRGPTMNTFNAAGQGAPHAQGVLGQGMAPQPGRGVPFGQAGQRGPGGPEGPGGGMGGGMGGQGGMGQPTMGQGMGRPGMRGGPVDPNDPRLLWQAQYQPQLDAFGQQMSTWAQGRPQYQPGMEPQMYREMMNTWKTGRPAMPDFMSTWPGQGQPNMQRLLGDSFQMPQGGMRPPGGFRPPQG